MATSHGGKRPINTTQSGYGHRHQQERRRVAPWVEAGEAFCFRCGGWIVPGTPWHLDHADDRQGYVGVSHARCNASAGARKGNAMRRRRRIVDADERAPAWERPRRTGPAIY